LGEEGLFSEPHNPYPISFENWKGCGGQGWLWKSPLSSSSLPPLTSTHMISLGVKEMGRGGVWFQTLTPHSPLIFKGYGGLGGIPKITPPPPNLTFLGLMFKKSCNFKPSRKQKGLLVVELLFNLGVDFKFWLQ